jgi:hypothetical protein
MTSQGTAHARFHRAISGGHLLNAEMAARELAALSLSGSLALVLLYRREGQREVRARSQALGQACVAGSATLVP